jgi:hypothetical protein
LYASEFVVFLKADEPIRIYKFKTFTMRSPFFLLLTLFFLAACNNNKDSGKVSGKSDDSVSQKITDTKSTSTVTEVNPLEKLLGSYVGPFGDNKITMLITKASKDSVAGRTIVGGNDRPFLGTFSKEGGNYSFKAREPGDDKDDGEFNFVINEDSSDVVTGSWKPFNNGRPAKEYELRRKTFSYRPDVGDYPQASQRELKAKDVENMMKEDLQYMRNEIFARHGYCFNKKDLRQQFEMQDWYVPNTVDIKGFLTDVEKKNIMLIKRYEKYADDYGDEYGR